MEGSGPTPGGSWEPGLISVVIPTYDRSDRMLGEAIDSVLAQDVPALELWIVDDGSDPPSEAFVRGYGDFADYVWQPNGGIGAARNTGIARCRGEYLACLDSDDVWMPDKLASQLAHLAARPDLDVVYGRAEQFHDEATDEEFRTRHPIKEREIDAHLSTAWLIRRTSFERVGPFGEHTAGGVDVDWQLRAREHGLVAETLPQVVFRRRIHQTNNSIVQTDANASRLRALKASLDRRREAGEL